VRFILFLFTTTLAIAGEFTTALGDQYPYMVSAMTTDAAGNTYVVGSRAHGGYFIGIFDPSPGALRAASTFFSGGSDVFVSKIDLNGKVLFTNTFAGKGNDVGNAIALDPSGNIYIAGTTTSDDFPLSKALQTEANSTYGTGFIIKLSNDGSTILYSTYFGGTLGRTSIAALTTDTKGNLYLTGASSSIDFPHTPGMPFGHIVGPGPAEQDGAIIASISAAGDKILYSGALVGTAPNCSGGSSCTLSTRMTMGIGIAVDPSGNAYIAGNTNTIDLPTTSGVIAAAGVGAFAAKVNAGGTGLGYVTYIGSGVGAGSPFISPMTSLAAVAVDAAGNAYLGGWTNDPHFPATPGSFEPVFNGPKSSVPPPSAEGFLAKLKPDGSSMTWATYLGGAYTPNTATSVQSIALDPGGNVWAVGTGASATFPNTKGWSTGPEFLVELNSAGSALTYSALYPSGTVGQSVALDASGIVHTAGVNGFVSGISVTAAPSMKIFDFQNAFGGDVTARISAAEVISIYGPGIGPPTAVTAAPTNGFYPKTLGGVQVTIDGQNMPLLYVSANQINAVVPMGLTSAARRIVRVTNGSITSPDYPVWMVASAAQSYPAVLNQDGTINSTQNPAKANSIVTFYATGWQSNFLPLADGQVATVALDQCLELCEVFTQSVGGVDAKVLYGGAAPGIVAGVTQFNLNVGGGYAKGSNQYTFTLIESFDVSVSIWITP
jgi:uncharacterized protein (TIGR03437 family)